MRAAIYFEIAAEFGKRRGGGGGDGYRVFMKMKMRSPPRFITVTLRRSR